MKFWILVIGIYLGFGAWNLALICNSVSAFGFRISNLIKDLLSQNETPYVQQPRQVMGNNQHPGEGWAFPPPSRNFQ